MESLSPSDSLEFQPQVILVAPTGDPGSRRDSYEIICGQQGIGGGQPAEEGDESPQEQQGPPTPEQAGRQREEQRRAEKADVVKERRAKDRQRKKRWGF